MFIHSSVSQTYNQITNPCAISTFTQVETANKMIVRQRKRQEIEVQIVGEHGASQRGERFRMKIELWEITKQDEWRTRSSVKTEASWAVTTVPASLVSLAHRPMSFACTQWSMRDRLLLYFGGAKSTATLGSCQARQRDSAGTLRSCRWSESWLLQSLQVTLELRN